MKILAVDSSLSTASVAICEDDRVISEFFIDAGLTHSETLAPMIDSSLKNAKIKPEEIDLYSVTCGPGSFTGIRIGLSTGKALAFANNKPCVGVSSIVALANNCLDFCKPSQIICVCIDARCGGVYNALFECSFSGDDKKLVRLCEDRAIASEDLLLELQTPKCDINFIGDGSLICYNLIRENFNPKNFEISLSKNNHINARNVAFLGRSMYDEGNYTNSFELSPNYIKIPQAERMLRENKLKIN